MEENKEQEVKEVVEQVKEEVHEEVKQDSANDRPEENWRAELARKNAEIDRLRAERDAVKQNTDQRRDPSDIRTWSDHELKMLAKSNDQSVAAYKDQAEEILLERKVRAIHARERTEQRRLAADLELREKYSDALDPSSEMARKMDRIMSEYDLDKTPAGRLVAAKIAAAEIGKGVNTSDAKARKREADRLRDVKSNMVDGDRAKPTDTGNISTPEKKKQLADKLMDSRHEDRQVEAVKDYLDSKGLTRDQFFGKR